MFGSSNTGGGFGGFGQQQQTQQPSGGLFGSGSTGTGAFGSTGTTGGFGQQAAASPFGAKPAFGAATTTPAAGGSLFGSQPAQQQSTGFGGFGTGTGTTGSAFGSTASTGTTGGLFGAAKPFGATTSAGTTGGLFGTAGASTGFGSTGAFGASANPNQVPSTGTANPPFSAFIEKDPGGSSTNHFQTITFQQPYQKFSLEELRLQDYAINQRFGKEAGFGTSTTGAFGGGFGATSQPAAGGFGATTTTGGGLFGSTGTTSTPFGQQPASTGFGASPAAQTGGGLFGAKPATGGLFGSTPASTGTTGGGLFGSSTTGTGTTGTGFGTGFGAQQQPQQQTGGLFGGAAATANKPAFGGFGTAATTTPATGFGGTTQQTGTGFGASTGGGLFGSGTGSTFGGAAAQPAAQPASNPFGGFGGASTQQQQGTQQQSGGLFGGGFGQQQTQQKPAGAFGAFGQTSTTTPAGSLFGGGAAQQPLQQQQQTGGLFGQKPAGAGGLFGGGTTGTTTGGGLFNQSTTTGTTGGGLFGGQQQQQTGGGGLFGGQQKPAGGLFGSQPSTTTTGGGLFGSSLSSGTTGTGGGGLFGGQQQQQQNQGGGLFNSMMGNNQQQQQPMQSFSASIAEPNPYGQNPLWQSVSGSVQNSPGPIATPLGGSTQKKKAAMIPLNKIAPKQPSLTPRLGSSFSRSGSPFAASSAGATPLGGSLGRSFAGSSKLHLFDSDDSVLSSGTFTPGSGSRVNTLKKLVIDKKIREQDLFSGSSSDRLSIDGSRNAARKAVTFEREDSEVTEDNMFRESSTSATAEELGYLRSSVKGKGRADISSNTASPITDSNDMALVKAGEPEHPKGYWMQPSLAKLKAMTPAQLSKVSNFTVGRRGYGQVRFDTAVDLTRIDLDDILDGIVTFDRRICTVYSDKYNKPAEGVELNVPALISLEDCFPQHKDSRAKIKDPEHPRIAAHVARLKGIKDTEFIDYNAATGVWIFKVLHFTTYGLEDDEEDTPIERTLPEQQYDDSLMDAVGEIDDSQMDDGQYNDTFEFSKRQQSFFGHSRSGFQGSLSGQNIVEDLDEHNGSFLGEGSVEYVDDENEIDEPAEPEVDMDAEHDDVQVMEDYPLFNRYSDDEDQSFTSPMKTNGVDADPYPTLPHAKDWTDQLNATLSVVNENQDVVWKHEKEISLGASTVAKDDVEKPSKGYDHMDLVADLYGLRGDAAERDEEEPLTSTNSYERAFRKSIRPCWMADGTIIHKDRNLNIADSKPWFSQILNLKSSDTSSTYASLTQRALRILELQRKNTISRIDEYGTPFLELKVDTPFSAFSDELSWDQDAHSQREKKVWQLASILFDEPDRKRDLMEVEESEEALVQRKELEGRVRKEKLSNFLREQVFDEANRQAQAANSAARVAIALLTARSIEDACMAISQDGNLRLATLLPVIGGSHEMRQDFQEQTKIWAERGVLAEIPLEIRALYELLAGNTCFSRGVTEPPEDIAPDFFFADEFGLDWKRAFGLKLWYGILPEDDISVAVHEYQKDLDTFPTSVPKPLPWQESGIEAPSRVSEEEVDIFWGLLKVYSENDSFPLESVLSWRDTSVPVTDHRLAWQLRSFFARRHYCDFSRGQTEDEQVAPALADRLTVQYAAQLEMSGHWEWAIFVLLHINDTDSRAIYVRNLIARNVKDLNDEAKLAFLKELNVPESWVYEAKALYARQSGDFVLEAYHLLDAKAWGEAHKTIIQKVAPEAIIHENLDNLKILLTKFTDTNEVSDWLLGGQVYLDYIRLLELTESAGGWSSSHARKLSVPSEEAKTIAKRLLDSLDGVERVTFLQKIAVGEISKFVSNFVLVTQMSKDNSQILRLPLSEEQFLKRTLNLANSYYKARLNEVY